MSIHIVYARFKMIFLYAFNVTLGHMKLCCFPATLKLYVIQGNFNVSKKLINQDLSLKFHK